MKERYIHLSSPLEGQRLPYVSTYAPHVGLIDVAPNPDTRYFPFRFENISPEIFEVPQVGEVVRWPKFHETMAAVSVNGLRNAPRMTVGEQEHRIGKTAERLGQKLGYYSDMAAYFGQSRTISAMELVLRGALNKRPLTRDPACTYMPSVYSQR